MRRHLATALRMTLVTALLFGLLYPLAITGAAQVLFPGAADGSLVQADGRVVGSALDRPGVLAGHVLLAAALGRRRRLRRHGVVRLQPRPDERGPLRPGARRRGRAGRGEPRSRPGLGPGRHGHHLGERPRPRHHRRQRPRAGGARGARPRPERGRRAAPHRRAHDRARPWGSSASRASTCCCSTWRSTRPRRPGRRRARRTAMADPGRRRGLLAAHAAQARPAQGLPRLRARRGQDLQHAGRGSSSRLARRGRRRRASSRRTAARRPPSSSRGSRASPSSASPTAARSSTSSTPTR